MDFSKYSKCSVTFDLSSLNCMSFHSQSLKQVRIEAWVNAWYLCSSDICDNIVLSSVTAEQKQEYVKQETQAVRLFSISQ